MADGPDPNQPQFRVRPVMPGMPGPPAQQTDVPQPPNKSVAPACCGFFLLLGLLACGGFVVLVKLAPPPPPPGPGQAAFDAANSTITTWKGKPGYGNTPEATALAENFAKAMKTMEPVFFTGGRDKGSFSLTSDNFITYCHLQEDRVCFLVHVPQLKNYKDNEVRNLLGNLAWTVARSTTREARGENLDTKIAVGLRGSVFYGVIVKGTLSQKFEAVEKKLGYMVDAKGLNEFFVAPVGSGTPAVVTSGD